MKDKLIALLEKFDQQAVRMRLLYTLVAVMIIGLIIDTLWISDNFKASKRLQAETVKIENNIDLLNIKHAEINASIANERRHPAHKQLAQVTQQLEDVKEELEEKTLTLVKPEIMTSVLKDILARSHKLSLLSLTKQPPQPLFEKSEQDVHVFRHAIVLQLQGKYADTQQFLKELESMPKKVNFESLNYVVDDYPLSTVTLVVSTLSLERKWIGG